jgi:hypothetical protein
MTIEELKERYDAGQITNFRGEIQFMLEDPLQGETSVNDFIRALDETLGPQAAQIANNDLIFLKEQNLIKYNERAAMDMVISKNEIEAKKNEVSLQSEKNAGLVKAGNLIAPPALEYNEEPLIYKPLEKFNIDGVKMPESGGIAGGLFISKNQNLYLIGAALVIIAAYFYFFKGKK